MHTSSSSAEIEKRIILKLSPSPTGPITLKQRVLLSEHVLRVRERVAMGDGFIPPGSTERMREELNDGSALLQLVEEANPKIVELNAKHEKLLQEIHTAPKGADISILQQECRNLALEITQIESSFGIVI